jgi:urease accessory protein
LLDTTARSGQPLGIRGDLFSDPAVQDPLPSLVEASLRFSYGGGRTVLTRQRVPYPFHATRPFYLDRARPEIATLYLQSASGGLYRGDSLALSIVADPYAAAHITTQASTIVHRTYERSITQRTRIEIREHAFAAVTPDPLVLFPGAEIACTTDVTLAPTASAIVTDGLTQHDPEGKDRPFGSYRNAIVVHNADGTVLLADRGSIVGERMIGPTSPLGPHRAAGTLLVLGHGSDRCDPDLLENRLAACGCTAGISKLPNDAGIGGRILAANGGALMRGLEVAFAIAFEALIGIPPARRPK